jgi:hypothetical protein
MSPSARSATVANVSAKAEHLDLELMILMEAHEDAFGMGRIEDCEWHLAQEHLSDVYTVVKRLRTRGHTTGRRRMRELIDAGVEPAENVD